MALTSAELSGFACWSRNVKGTCLGMIFEARPDQESVPLIRVFLYMSSDMSSDMRSRDLYQSILDVQQALQFVGMLFESVHDSS